MNVDDLNENSSIGLDNLENHDNNEVIGTDDVINKQIVNKC